MAKPVGIGNNNHIVDRIGKYLNKHFHYQGRFARFLSVVYVVWFLILNAVIVNTYSDSNHHKVTFLKDMVIFLFIVLSGVPAMIISRLEDGTYEVVVYTFSRSRNRQLEKYLERLDDKQRATRRKIFERSYAILATLILVAALAGPGWIFSSHMTASGAPSFGINILVFVIILPAIVAVWSKQARAKS